MKTDFPLEHSMTFLVGRALLTIHYDSNVFDAPNYSLASTNFMYEYANNEIMNYFEWDIFLVYQPTMFSFDIFEEK